MRIAISAENNQGLESAVSGHFGRCPYFILVQLEEGQVKNVTGVENRYFGDHAPGKVPAFIQEQGANVMLSGGMGGRAVTVFQQMGIQVATGATGTVGQTLQRYLDGELSGTQPCADSEKQHGRSGSCSHHENQD